MEMSDKHGARMADDLSKDTRAGHQELRELEPDAVRIDLTQSQDGVLDDDEAAARSELARFLQPSAFPARAGQLIESAKEAFATDEVLTLLGTLPDQVFENVQEVWIALGGDVEAKRS